MSQMNVTPPEGDTTAQSRPTVGMYDRPEKRGISPLLLVAAVALLIVVAAIVYFVLLAK